MVLPVPIFVFTAPEGPGLLQVNARIAGEVVRDGKLSVPLSDGVQYISFLPLYPGALPFTRRMAILAGQLIPEANADEAAQITVWPGGIHDVELHPATPPAYAPLRRHVVDALRWQDAYGAHKATLLSEGVLVLELESDDGARLSIIPQCMPETGKMELNSAAGSPSLWVTGPVREGGEYLLMVARTASGFDVLFDGAGDSVIPPDGENALRVLADLSDTVGHGVLLTHALSGGAYLPSASENIWIHGQPRWPRTPFATVCAFIEAICLERQEEALGYLAPELASRAFDGLYERFSGYSGWEEPRYLTDLSGTPIALFRELSPNHRVADIYRFELKPGGEQGDYRIHSGWFWEGVGDRNGEQIDVFA